MRRRSRRPASLAVDEIEIAFLVVVERQHARVATARESERGALVAEAALAVAAPEHEAAAGAEQVARAVVVEIDGEERRRRGGRRRAWSPWRDRRGRDGSRARRGGPRPGARRRARRRRRGPRSTSAPAPAAAPATVAAAQLDRHRAPEGRGRRLVDEARDRHALHAGGELLEPALEHRRHQHHVLDQDRRPPRRLEVAGLERVDHRRDRRLRRRQRLPRQLADAQIGARWRACGRRSRSRPGRRAAGRTGSRAAASPAGRARTWWPPAPRACASTRRGGRAGRGSRDRRAPSRPPRAARPAPRRGRPSTSGPRRGSRPGRRARAPARARASIEASASSNFCWRSSAIARLAWPSGLARRRRDQLAVGRFGLGGPLVLELRRAEVAQLVGLGRRRGARAAVAARAEQERATDAADGARQALDAILPAGARRRRGSTMTGAMTEDAPSPSLVRRSRAIASAST